MSEFRPPRYDAVWAEWISAASEYDEESPPLGGYLTDEQLAKRPSRADFCRGEICTLCGSPAAWAKVSEEPFQSNEEPFIRHPLTAYVCNACFVRLFRPYITT